MLKAGAVRRCKPGASDDDKTDKPTGKESQDAPAPGASGANAPGATSASRSEGAPAPGANAPGLSSFWRNYDNMSLFLILTTDWGEGITGCLQTRRTSACRSVRAAALGTDFTGF